VKVLVLLEIGADVRIAPARDPRSGRVREEWLVREIDPGSTRALELALRLKAQRPCVQVTAVHLGPAENERWLRYALARGCDRAVRVWDDGSGSLAGAPPGGAGGLGGLRAAGKAVVLAAAARATGFDLALTGAAGVVDACGHLGVSLAEHLGVPCVTQATALMVDEEPNGTQSEALRVGGRVEVVRGLDKGFVERVEASLPLVITVAALASGTETPATLAPPAAALLAAEAAEIPVWDLADLGVPFDSVRRAEQPLRPGRPDTRHPRLRPLVAPNSALPAFERILALIQGPVNRREGRVVRRPTDEMVDEIFRVLKDEGWLDHLQSQYRPPGHTLADGPAGALGSAAGDARP